MSSAPTVSLPDKFSGDRRILRTFLNQLELVFLINPSKYHNDSIKQGSLEILRFWPTFKDLLTRTFSLVDASIQAPSKSSGFIKELSLPEKMFLPLTIQPSKSIFTVAALIDSGADESMIDEDIVRTYRLPMNSFTMPIALFLADGKPATKFHVTYNT
ncbi:hypothetical protein BASA62_005017 [Batrachochytrium salamandrivorans]|nr:hypothetical protein BASA62_005017 [Batrachochytrium salamandrivorans]